MFELNPLQFLDSTKKKAASKYFQSGLKFYYYNSIVL